MRSKFILAAVVVAGLIVFAAPASAQLPRSPRLAYSYPTSFDYYSSVYATPYFSQSAFSGGLVGRPLWSATLSQSYGASTTSGGYPTNFGGSFSRPGLYGNYGQGLSDYAPPYYGQGLYTPSNVQTFNVPYVTR
jgi:hypothetical protein